MSHDPWHLFYVEAEGHEEGDERCWHWLVSAQSASQAKAEELARAAVDDVIPESMHVSHSHFVCVADRDVFDECSGRCLENVDNHPVEMLLRPVSATPARVLFDYPPCVGHSRPLSEGTVRRIQRGIRKYLGGAR